MLLLSKAGLLWALLLSYLRFSIKCIVPEVTLLSLN